MIKYLSPRFAVYKLEKGLAIPSEAYEMQMVSEIYEQLPNSKTKEGWHTLYKGRDNHLWDCGYMVYIAIEFDGLKERIFKR